MLKLKVHAAIAVTSLVLVSSTFAQVSDESDLDRFRESTGKAIEFLRSSQAEDGSFSGFTGPGITALVATAMMKNGIAADDPTVAKSLTYLEGHVQASGGIHPDNSLLKNYETSLSMLCFIEANQGGKYDETIQNAASFIKKSQWTDAREIVPADMNYGGFGYGKHGRPDLSNTQFTVDALLAAGEDPDSESIQAALKFITRTQNHVSEHNDNPKAKLINDGGFFYTASGDGETKAETEDDGGLRSYASMTYAGLKSMLYAGVDKDDTRVKAAVEWIRNNYNLETNPGLGNDGLYYYYHIFAKALDAFEEDIFVDRDGNKHDWREELREEMYSRQNADGSWTNKGSERWLENDPNLVTAYVLLALSYCEPKE